MSAREGMANLIARLRPLVNDKWQLRQDTATGDGAGTVFWLNYKPTSGGTVSIGGTVQGTAAWALDSTFGRLALASPPANGAALVIEYRSSQWTDDDLQETLEGNVALLESHPLSWLPDSVSGRTEYHRAAVGWRDLEEASSGTIYWAVRDGTGAEVGTANYTPNYVDGLLRWAVDQGGSAYYLTARSYDLYSAAADLWLKRAASQADWYKFGSDGQTYERQQAHAQALAMAETMRKRAGQNKSRSEVRSNSFQRTDINPRQVRPT